VEVSTDRLVAVVAYDIAADHRRSDVSAVLGAYGARVQLSVFEIELDDSLALRRLTKTLATMIDPAQDQIRLWPLSSTVARGGTIVLGSRTLEERSDFYLV
jgi:CRISPR-associated endonuclease Cas2